MFTLDGSFMIVNFNVDEFGKYLAFSGMLAMTV